MESSVTKFLWKYARHMKLLGFYVILSVFAASFLSRLLNYYSAEIVNIISQNAVSPEVLKQIFMLIAMILLAISLQSLVEFIQRIVETRVMPYHLGKISRDLFCCAHKHSSSFFAEEMSGNIAGKIKNIVNNSERAYYHLRQGLVRSIIAIIISVSFVSVVDVGLALSFLGVSLVFLLLSIKLKLAIIPLSEKKAKLNSESSGILVDSISNSDLVKNFSNYLYEKRRYYISINKLMKALRKETLKSALIDYLSANIYNLMTIIFYVLIFYYWYSARFSIGGVVLCLSLISSMSNQVINLNYFITEFTQIVGSLKDGLKLLSMPCEITDIPEAKPLKISQAAINLDKIKYHYKTSTALFDDFSLDIQPGEKIGLVGQSGSGKSTLVRLISRYYDIQSGAISIDGQNIAEVSQDSLRRQIALIPQDPSLFHRTIMENLRYGNLKATDEEVIEAAKKAYCHDFIMRMPNGYDSKVGERGIMLSGGERQRIAIARAILKNAPILILDEATSALDSESEQYIQSSLRELMKDKTVIAIAHRLSTLKEMDRIIVLEKGQIIEQGTHTGLIRKKGKYFEFYNMQTSGFLKMSE